MHFYTSINNHYLAKARVLAKSVKKYNPTAKFSLILSDHILDDFKLEKEPFDEVLTLEQLGFQVENLDFWIYLHNVVELCTAVKGQALVKFLEEGSDKVIYLDPDIVVFAEFKELDELLDKYDVLLTPHQCAPEKEYEDIKNNEICSLKHGIYNFGFYAVRNSANGLAFARWWRDRLLDFCYDDIPNGIFTDQRWGDLVPAMFDGVYILRSPAYNVSTWNLTNRLVTKKDGCYLVNEIPLKFYHFSGFDSGAQEIMLKMYGGDNPVLFELRKWYIERCNEEGQKKYAKIFSCYDFYDNGRRVAKEERILLRRRMDVYETFKMTNPYIIEQDMSYYKWFRNENPKKTLRQKIKEIIKIIKND